jgi:hypothetical protein
MNDSGKYEDTLVSFVPELLVFLVGFLADRAPCGRTDAPFWLTIRCCSSDSLCLVKQSRRALDIVWGSARMSAGFIQRHYAKLMHGLEDCPCGLIALY